jgi:serine/threonine protein kinase
MIDNSFKVDMLLGTGGSSRVYSCFDPSGDHKAVKIIRKDKQFSPRLMQELLINEDQVMQIMKEHPNVLNTYGINLNGLLEVDGKYEDIMYCIIELARKGSIKTFVKKAGCLEESICKFYFVQLANALSFLHSHDIAHMDVKLDNILLDENYNLKIADLGTCVSLQNGYTTKRCGTKHYMAPEITENNGVFNAFKSDAYSLGVTLFMLLTGQYPTLSDFTTLTQDSEDEEMQMSEHQFGLSLQNVSAECRDLLSKLLCKDSEKRSTVFDILDHPWVTNSSDMASASEVYSEMSAREEFIIAKHLAKN